MGGVGEDSDFKSRLVIEICSISSRSSTCVHRRFHNPIKAPFIDWYRLLRVEEDAEIDIIRKQYRKMALQLHPDKNGHPKAEVAFKLVSEAYACLSDKTRRRAFDSGRWKSYCTQCNNQSSQSNFRGSSEAGKLKGSDPRVWARSNKSLQGLREIRDRFKEEARVIENCLRAHAASKMDSPLFEPSDYVFQGYPHHRTRVYNNPEDFWYLRSGNSRKYDHRSGTCDSPIFEIRSERSLRSKSACLGS